MKFILQSKLSRMVMILAVTTASAGRVLGCGMDWDIVRNHFDGVNNESGIVDLWDKFGDLDLGKGESLPLYYAFDSGFITSSPYLGQGWYFPLLESRVVQKDENTFKVIMPNGKYYWFWRDKNNPNILNGQQGWKAEVRENSIVATAECGGRAVFTKGKLTSFSTKSGKVLDFLQENGKTSEIRSGSEVLLKLENNPSTGELCGLSHGGKTVKLEQGGLPQVQSIKGQSLVTGIAPSLSKVILPDGTIKNYEFSVNDKIQPVLKIGGRELVWDCASGKILQDGDWSYPVTDIKTAGIHRKSGQGQTESWFYDGGKGQETIEKNGTRRIKTWFLSGKLSGRTRSIETIADKKISKLNYIYDQAGRRIRVVENGVALSATEFKQDGSFTEQFPVANYNVEYLKLGKDISDNALSKEKQAILSKFSGMGKGDLLLKKVSGKSVGNTGDFDVLDKSYRIIGSWSPVHGQTNYLRDESDGSMTIEKNGKIHAKRFYSEKYNDFVSVYYTSNCKPDYGELCRTKERIDVSEVKKIINKTIN